MEMKTTESGAMGQMADQGSWVEVKRHNRFSHACLPFPSMRAETGRNPGTDEKIGRTSGKNGEIQNLLGLRSKWKNKLLTRLAAGPT